MYLFLVQRSLIYRRHKAHKAFAPLLSPAADVSTKQFLSSNQDSNKDFKCNCITRTHLEAKSLLRLDGFFRPLESSLKFWVDHRMRGVHQEGHVVFKRFSFLTLTMLPSSIRFLHFINSLENVVFETVSETNVDDPRTIGSDLIRLQKCTCRCRCR